MISELWEIVAPVASFTLPLRLQELPERKLGATGRDFFQHAKFL